MYTNINQLPAEMLFSIYQWLDFYDSRIMARLIPGSELLQKCDFLNHQSMFNRCLNEISSIIHDSGLVRTAEIGGLSKKPKEYTFRIINNKIQIITTKINKEYLLGGICVFDELIITTCFTSGSNNKIRVNYLLHVMILNKYNINTFNNRLYKSTTHCMVSRYRYIEKEGYSYLNTAE